MRSIPPGALRAMLVDGAEMALLDVREEGAFGASHVFQASPAPLSRLELRAPVLVPRRPARVVLCDAGEGLAARGAAVLERMGYADVSVLEGGTPAWERDGFELFSGVNVPSKAFGELVEHRDQTPSVSATELDRLRREGEDLVILDSRPFEEYHARNIPGGICCPGGELVYRAAEVAPSPDTLVVVNCAGRTRSIIGAQSLINAGVPNRVVALRNGTMGWHLAGLALETGGTRRAPPVSGDARAAALAAAGRVSARYGVRRIDADTFARWRDESGERTLFVLDVRDPREYAAGHLPGARSAPGGQLVQETESHLGTLRSRVVLVDDDGVRAVMAASWLVQMGWDDVAVLDADWTGEALETGSVPPPCVPLPDGPEVEPAAALAALEAGEATLVDLSSSRAYRAGHPAGAWFAIRARLAASLPRIDPRGRLLLTSEDGRLARLALPEVAALGVTDVAVVAGGNAAWVEAGLPVEPGEIRMADPPDDVWERPYERDWGREEAMQAYLDWEVALVEQVARDGTARFRGPGDFPPG